MTVVIGVLVVVGWGVVVCEADVVSARAVVVAGFCVVITLTRLWEHRLVCVVGGGIIMLVVGGVICCCRNTMSASLFSLSNHRHSLCTDVLMVFRRLTGVDMVCVHTRVCIPVLAKVLHQLADVFGGVVTVRSAAPTPSFWIF